MLRNCFYLLGNHVILPRPILTAGSQSAPWFSTTSPGTERMERPKRPRSAWILYLQDNLARTVEENPSFNQAAAFKKLAGEYKNIDSSLQKKYKQLSQNESEAYKKQKEAYDAYIAQHGPEVDPSKEKVGSKIKDHKKQLRALGMPKKPPNAYICFAMDYMKKANNSSDLIKEARNIGAAWSNISEAEKSKWYEVAATKDQEYRKKLKQWEDEMTAQGRITVVNIKGKKK